MGYDFNTIDKIAQQLVSLKEKKFPNESHHIINTVYEDGTFQVICRVKFHRLLYDFIWNNGIITFEARVIHSQEMTDLVDRYIIGDGLGRRST